MIVESRETISTFTSVSLRTLNLPAVNLFSEFFIQLH